MMINDNEINDTLKVTPSIPLEHPNNQVMSPKLMLALMSPLFPLLDSQLRAGRHISVDELENHAFLMDFQEPLEEFYARYAVELIRAPEGFFYLRPRSTTIIPRSVLTELEMLVGKVLCYLYLSPERLANNGIFTYSDLYEELMSLSDEQKLLKLVNNRSTGSDLDRQKLQEKLRSALNRLRRLGMVRYLGQDTSQFTISEAVFRFGADVRSGDSPIEAQLRLIRYGETISLGQQTLIDTSESSTDSNLSYEVANQINSDDVSIADKKRISEDFEIENADVDVDETDELDENSLQKNNEQKPDDNDNQIDEGEEK